MAGQLKAWADRVRWDRAPFVLGGVVVAAAVAWGLLAPGPQDARVFAVGWDEPGLGLFTIAFGLAKTVAKWLLSALLLGVAVKLLRRPAGAMTPAPTPAAPAPLPAPEAEAAKPSEAAEALTAVYSGAEGVSPPLVERIETLEVALHTALVAQRDRDHTLVLALADIEASKKRLDAIEAKPKPARKRAAKKPATKGAK